MTNPPPGVSLDAEGTLTVNIGEMLAAIGLPDTPENQEAMVESITEIARRELPKVTLIQDFGPPEA